MRPGPSRPPRILLTLVAWPVLLAVLLLAAGSTGLAAAQPAEPWVAAPAAVTTPDVWFTVTPTSEYGKVSSYCTTPCLTVTYTTQYHYGPTCGFPVNFYWDKTYPAGGAQLTGYPSGCTTPKMKQLQIDGVTYGTHQICAIPYPPGISNPIVKCVTFHVLKPAPKPTPTPRPTPKPTATPTPTVSPSSSPSPSEVATPTAPAIALATTTPSPATAPPTSPNETPQPTGIQTGGAALLDFTPLVLGGAILLVLIVGVMIAIVRRARVLPPPG